MKKIISVIAIGILTFSVYAQKQQERHEFSAWAGGGISTFMYDLSLGERNTGFGAIGGLGYNYFISYNWSIGVGAEFSLLNAKMTLPPFYDEYDKINTYSDLYRYGFSGQSFDQSQRGYYINIPLQVKYQRDAFWNENHKLYAAIGPKIGIPVQTLYNTKGDVRITGVELNAYHEPITRDWYGENDDLKNQGFGLFSYNEEKKDLDFGVNIIASVEAGVKWDLRQIFSNSFKRPWSVYTGLYFDYGLNDLRRGDKAQQFFEYERFSSPVSYASNSALSSQRVNSDGVKTNFTDKVNTMAFGAKLQFTFGIEPFEKKAKKEKGVEVEKPYEGLTATQMEDIMARNTKEMMDFQRKEFDALKALIEKEDPDFTGCVVGFDTNKSEILLAMFSELDRKVALMKKYPKANIMIEGHTDDQGGNEKNMKLGLDRANAVKAYMVAKGIASGRMSVTSKGAAEPAIPNASENNRRYNRRVEFVLVQ